MNVRPESSSHWYHQDGRPCYEVPRADGNGMKPTTLREARQMHLVPSVTSVLGIVRKPFLESWKTNQYLEAALEFGEHGAFTTDNIDEVIESAEARMTVARDTGSQWHAEMERIVRALEERAALDLDAFAMPEETINEVVRWYRQFELHARHTEMPFACASGYGGCIDWVGQSRLGDGPGAYLTVLDWKTQATKQNQSFRTYPEWAVQLAAYAYGIGKPDALLVNVCISTTEPGRIEHFVWDRRDNDDNYQAFMDAFAVWRKRSSRRRPSSRASSRGRRGSRATAPISTRTCRPSSRPSTRCYISTASASGRCSTARC